MDIKQISRSYKRTVSVIAPDGREAWITHEAVVLADVNENDAQDIRGCFSNLEGVVKKEVADSINHELEKLKSMKSSTEPFSGTAPSMSSLKQL